MISRYLICLSLIGNVFSQVIGISCSYQPKAGHYWMLYCIPLNFKIIPFVAGAAEGVRDWSDHLRKTSTTQLSIRPKFCKYKTLTANGKIFGRPLPPALRCSTSSINRSGSKAKLKYVSHFSNCPVFFLILPFSRCASSKVLTCSTIISDTRRKQCSMNT